MVADDAEELVADEPEVPVLEMVTQESPREEAASMRTLIASGLEVLFGAGVVALAPPSQATGCGSGGSPWGGGGFCDTDYRPDGSYMHCESVYVMGYGGENCFRVFPPK